MRIAIVFCLIFILSHLTVTADRYLSKDEVRAYWNNNLKIDIKQGFSSFPDSLMVDFVNDLKATGVDTIGGFYCSGYLKTIPLSEYIEQKVVDCDGTHWTGFVYWKSKGFTYSKMFFKHCNFPKRIISSSVLLDFGVQNMDTLKRESIIQINGVCTDDKGAVKNIEIHDLNEYGTRFMICCEIDTAVVFKTFELDDIENVNYLFHNENQSSIQNQWRMLIEKEIEVLR